MTPLPRLTSLISRRVHLAATTYGVCSLAIGFAVGLASLGPAPAREITGDELSRRVDRLERALLVASLPRADRASASVAASRESPLADGSAAPVRPMPRPTAHADASPRSPLAPVAPAREPAREPAHPATSSVYTPAVVHRMATGSRAARPGDLSSALALEPRRPPVPTGAPAPEQHAMAGQPQKLTASELDATVAGQAAASAAVPASRAGEEEPDPELNALNRTLVEAGGLLLPPWTVEVQPATSYSYRGSSALLIAEQDGRRAVLAQDAKSSTLENSLTARVGLPASFQAEVRVPQKTQREKVTAGSDTESRSDSGLGDVEVSVSHQFVRESKDLPDLLGEIRYKAPTGDDAFGDGGGLPLGSGFHALSGNLTAVKSFDPVVFLAKVGYTENFEDNKQGYKVDPGDTISFAAGTILAAGPGVSLRTLLALDFTDETAVDGRRIDGSDLVEGVLQLGAATTIADKTLLDFGVNVGVTDDAPDIGLRLATAYRF